MSDDVKGLDPTSAIDLGRSSSFYRIVDVSPTEFAIFDQYHNHAPLDDKISRQMLSGSRVAVMSWGVRCIGLKAGDDLVSINVTNFSKRARKNAWGRYLNFYLAYTVPEHRQKGYAAVLVDHVEKTAIDQGYSRMKSLAGSYLGVRLHMHFGHQFWGIGKKGGELVVDTPLGQVEEFPDGVPIEARNASNEPHRMDLEQIAKELWEGKRFQVRLPSEAMAAYIKKERR